MSKRPKRVVETMDYAGMMRRLLKRWITRCVDGDVVDLAELVEFRDLVDDAIHQALVDGRAKNTSAWSLADIGKVLGMSPQAVEDRIKNYKNPDERKAIRAKANAARGAARRSRARTTPTKRKAVSAHR